MPHYLEDIYSSKFYATEVDNEAHYLHIAQPHLVLVTLVTCYPRMYLLITC
jgi:hypothetical protein